MENAPIITLNGRSPYPGVDHELWERYIKWCREVYIPLMMKDTPRRGVYLYQITKENQLYPELLSVHHHENPAFFKNVQSTQQNIDISNDITSWRQRNVVDTIWGGAYSLTNSFRSKQSFPGENRDTRVENAPVMHIEASRLSAENQEKYFKWFSDFGSKIFIPLFLNSPGLRGYDWFYYVDLGVSRRDKRDTEYPGYLTVIYFDTLNSFKSFEKSPEHYAFLKAIRSVFPFGIKYDWYVEYELIQSWRK